MNKLTSWKQVKIRQYLDIISLNPEEYKSHLEFRCDYISILYDCDVEEIEKLSITELFELENLSWIKQLPTNYEKEILDFKLIDFHNIKLGEFIDVEHYISDLQNIPILLAILYHRFKYSEFNVLELEPYVYNPKDRVEIFEELSMYDCFGVIKAYISFHDMIMENYKELFYSEPSDEDEEEEMTEEVRKEIEEENKQKKFSWEKLIYTISNDDITKFDKVTDLNLILVLNYLSMKKGGII